MSDSNGEPILRFGMVREEIKQILARKIPALADRILVDRQRPTGVDARVMLLIESGTERKTLAVAGGSPEFSVSGAFGVTMRCQGRTEADVLATIDALEPLVLSALLSQPDALMDIPGFDKVTGVTRTPAMAAEGDRIEAQVSLAFECTWNEFYPPATPDDLRRLHIVLDAIEPFDPTGAYPPIDDFPAPAAPPRSSGPDGRAEIGIDVNLPL